MPKVSPRTAERGPGRDLAELAADPGNPREISDEALAGLEASVDDFGDLSGIVFNRRTQQLVTGHQRVTALKRAGATTWTHADPSGGRGLIVHPKTGEEFPVRIVDWDEPTQRKANLVANSPAIAGEYTAAALEQLRALEEDAAFTALRLDALQELIVEAHPLPDDPAGGETDPDEVPEEASVPHNARLGDVWILGDNRLMCGDSTDPAQVARLMDGQKAVLMATDPPYGVDYNVVKANIINEGRLKFKDWGDMANDGPSPEQLDAFLKAVFAAAAPVLGERPAVYVWHPSANAATFVQAIESVDFFVHRQIIWFKPHMVLTRSGMYHWQHEPCFYGWRRGDMPPWYGDKTQTSVWQVGKDDGKALHPTQKPVELFEIPMHNHVKKGEVCYEPFSGSGSQLIAGERLGRRVFAMELNPRWVDVAVARWEAFTGRKAECHHAENVGRPADPVHGTDDVAF